MRSAAVAPAGEEIGEQAPQRAGKSAWALPAGAAIAPGRTVLQRMGGGKRYEVYLVWDEWRFSLLVAKLLRPDAAEDEHARRHLRREASLLERLAHPALVRGLGAQLEGPYPHLLMEQVEGPTLQKLVKRYGPLATEQAVPLALQLAGALQYLANEEVVHLDVKPANVIVGIRPTLIDLSIARSLQEAAQLQEVVGTQGYMAPEQRGPGHARIGSPADVWALGATLYYALTCSRPTREDAGRGALLSRAPAPLAAIVRRMLDPDPARRPTPREVVLGLEPLVAP